MEIKKGRHWTARGLSVVAQATSSICARCLAQGLVSNERDFHSKNLIVTTVAYSKSSWMKCGEGTICCICTEHVPRRVPQCGKIAVWQLCMLQTTAFVETWFMMAWTWHVWINANEFCPVLMWQDCSLTAVQRTTALSGTVMMAWIWSMRLDQCHGVRLPMVTNSRFAQGKPFPQKQAFVDISAYSVVAQATQDSPKASPRAIFKWKNFIEQLYKAIAPNKYADWKVEKAECQYAPMMCQSVPTCG